MMNMENDNCEVLPLLTTLKKILVNNYVLPGQENSHVDPKRLLKFFLPLIIGGIPYATGSLGYLYITMSRNLWPKPLQSLILLMQILTGILALIIFTSNSKNYYISINRMSKYLYGAPRKSIDIIRTVDTWCSILFYSSKIVLIGQAIFLYVSGAFCDDPEFKEDDGYICGSYNPLWFFFKVDYPLVHLTIRMCAIYVTASYLPIMIILIGSPLTTSYLTLIRIRELEKKLILWNQYSDKKPGQMIFFVKYHAEIAECIRFLNKSLSYDHLPVQIFMPIILALYMYQIILTPNIVAVGGLASWFLPYFVLCLLGERLQHECSLLPNLVYSHKWYNMEDKNEKVILRMFLQTLSQPMKLKLRPLAALNHLLIIKILKTAYSFLIFFFDTTK